MLNETLRSRWFAAGLHAGLWLLLLLAMTAIGGKRPRFQEADTDPTAVSIAVPVAKLETVFSPANWQNKNLDPAAPNPFVTRHFFPAPVPPPVVPTTRKVELAYQGFYQTPGRPKQALIRMGEAILNVPMGGSVVSNLFVVEATALTLMLTNSAAQTNILALNLKKELEVPLK